MNKKKFQYILGYLIGGSIFLILIPYGMFRAARSFDHIIGIRLIPLSALRLALSLLLLAVGFVFAFWSNIIQNKIGKGGPLEIPNVMEVSPKTRNLVVSGPYRYTRNPMLFGACMLYFAVAAFLNSVVALAIAVFFMVFMLIFVKLIEERRLLKDFGSPYEEYRQRVSMFFPWFPKNNLGNKQAD